MLTPKFISKTSVLLMLLHSCIREVKFKLVSVFIALTFNNHRKISKTKIVHKPAIFFNSLFFSWIRRFSSVGKKPWLGWVKKKYCGKICTDEGSLMQNSKRRYLSTYCPGRTEQQSTLSTYLATDWFFSFIPQ